MYTCISRLDLYLWGRDVEDFCNLGIQLFDIGESMDSTCGTPVSQLGVEDEPRSWVFWWPSWWRWRRWKRRCCGLHTPLILPLVLCFLFFHDLSPCCLGIFWAHSLLALHQAPVQEYVSPLGAPQMVPCSGKEGNSVLSLALATHPTNHPELRGEENGWISDESSLVTVDARGQPDPTR